MAIRQTNDVYTEASFGCLLAGSPNLQASHTMMCRLRWDSTTAAFDNYPLGFYISTNIGGSYVRHYTSLAATAIEGCRQNNTATTVDSAPNTGPYASTTQWRHYALTYDSATTTIRLYVDGVQVATVASPVVTAPTSTSNNFACGPGTHTAADIMFFNVALTAAQVQRLARERRPTQSLASACLCWIPALAAPATDGSTTLTTVGLDLSGRGNNFGVLLPGTGNAPVVSNVSVPAAWGTPSPRTIFVPSSVFPINTPTGTLLTTGAAAVTALAAVQASGTLVETGTAVSAASAASGNASGVLLASGVAATGTGVAESASGVLLTSGTSAMTAAAAASASGVLRTSGAAATTNTAATSAAGVVLTTGTASTGISLPVAASGELRTSGAATTTLSAAMAASGVLLTTGVAAMTSSSAGSLAATSSLLASGTAAMTAAAGFFATGELRSVGAVSMLSTAPVSAAGSLRTTGTVSMSGGGGGGSQYSLSGFVPNYDAGRTRRGQQGRRGRDGSNV